MVKFASERILKQYMQIVIRVCNYTFTKKSGKFKYDFFSL